MRQFAERRSVFLLAIVAVIPIVRPNDVIADDANPPVKTDLFEAGTEGYKLYRIPGIVVTKRGTVLAYCEARKSDSGDWGPIDVLMRRSLDGGKTWLPRQQIVHVEGNLPLNPVATAQNLDRPGENTVNNPVAIVDQATGAVHFLYCLEYMRCFYLRSDDDGVTWTDPVEITATFEGFRSEYDWKVLATGPAHGIQLARGEHRGRLVVPVWLSLGTGGHAHRPSVTATIYSDDHGKTWQRGAIAVPDTRDFIYRTGLLTVARFDEAWVRAGGPIEKGYREQADSIEADVCVYGGTSGGVVAAVQAARMGKRVVLVEPGRHLGGMTSGGLSAVDIGDPRSVGGIAREYFTRLVDRYGKRLNWDEAFRGKGGPATGGAYSIEPHVAERVFEAMAREAGVVVLRDARLKSVTKQGNRIRGLSLQLAHHGPQGAMTSQVRGKVFIDATYEGDLMAAAGVSYTLIREGNAKYGESYNGIHYPDKYKPRTNHQRPGANGRVPGGQGVWDRDFPLDPYVVKGDSSSGLLPLINEGEPGTPGEPAPGVMAYCFRLCLSTADDRLPIMPPPDYDAKRYELVARFVEACEAIGDDMDLRWFSKHDPLPHHKWDFNTATLGGNLPGASWEWPEASYDRRVEIAGEIEHYHRGLLHFLATDPRVPEKVRSDMQRFGLPQDEFLDTGGWPHQLYIREGRRMVSDLVLTEHHTFGREIAPQSIGLGSYGTDVHEIRRIVKDGVVTREGKVAGGRGGFGPYQIGYGAVVPKANQCENLLVTFALSASHTALASIRMEPVFMVTSQSAATAACLAIDADVPVQKVDYDRLRIQLIADGQVLTWSRNAARKAITPDKLAGVALDDSSAEFSGEWAISNGQPSLLGNSYRHDNNQQRGQKTARFTAELPAGGDYEVRLLYTWHENRSSKTSVTIRCGDGTKTVMVNQREPALINLIPRALGVFRFDAGAKGSVTVSNEGADGYVVVDGVQFVPVDLAREERDGKRATGFADVEM